MKDGEICSIYLLTNIINNKIYIGQTWLSLLKRMGKNGSNYKNSIYLYYAIQKYGVENFQYQILIQCRDQVSADYLEEYFIQEYNSRNSEIGYNIKCGGSVGKHSEVTKQKISKALKEKEWSPEALLARSKVGKMWKGKKRGPHTEEWKQNNSKFFKEHHAQYGHPMLGKRQTEEARLKISQALKGRKDSPERNLKRRKLRVSLEIQQAVIARYQENINILNIKKEFNISVGCIYRILQRNNIPLSYNFSKWSGKKHKMETKEKMSEKRTEYWKEKK